MVGLKSWLRRVFPLWAFLHILGVVIAYYALSLGLIEAVIVTAFLGLMYWVLNRFVRTEIEEAA